MAATMTIGGTVVTMIEDQFDLTNSIGERQRLRCQIIDYTGTLHFVKGEQVVVTDPVVGTVFSGYLNTDKEHPQYPSGTILHDIDCIDPHYLADKRTYTRTYSTPAYAGKIAGDMLHDVLLAEGVTQNFAVHFDNTITDFNQGILSGTVGLQTVGSTTGDGDLELVPAGSAVTISETTTANFATGTLANVTASTNSLTLTTESAISLNAVLSLDAFNNYVYMTIWSGSMVVGSNDTLHYEIWISSTSPVQQAGVNLVFSDTTQLLSTQLTDTHGIGAAPWNSLAGIATNTWYIRDIALTGLSGKTINTVTAAFDGNVGTLKTGTYQAYFRNIYLQSHSGSPFFSTSATTTQVNPPTVNAISGFVAGVVTTTVVQSAINPSGSRVSTGYSIDAVKMLKSSLMNWTATTPTTGGTSSTPNTSVVINVSYDGGASYHPCTNNAALSALPPGTTVTGLSITLQELLSIIGPDPTTLPILSAVSIVLQSAPNASKTDLLTSYTTQTNWNSGTLTNTTATSAGTLTLTNVSRDWNNNAITSQTSFFNTGGGQSAASGSYTMTVTGGHTWDGKSRLDFAGSLQDFTLDVDITFDPNSQTGIVYRTTGWQTGNNTFGWLVDMSTGAIEIGYGSNISSGAGSFTSIKSVSQTFYANTTYHLTIVVSGTLHNVYLNHSTTPILSALDPTYVSSGNIGFRQYNFDSVSHVSTWDNLVITSNYTGSWVSPSTSLTSVGTYGTSVISWTETNTNAAIGSIVAVQSSIDGGTTYKTCTNGGIIPNFTAAQSLSGVSLLLKVNLTTTGVSIPIISQLVARIIGNYGTVTGTRSTVPLGNDTMVRANQSGLGTAFDSQTYTKVGTGTDAISGDEATITNTTGDVHEVLGNRTWTDEDGTVRFQLSASTISAGIELRYTDSTHYYRLAASTTALSIIKQRGTITTTLATVTSSLSTGTWYRMRFRVVGAGPVSLYGRVWADQTLEPTTWGVTGNDT